MEPGGPRMVETHSYMLSPLGPALQFGGGSTVISANSFWILFADVERAFDPFAPAAPFDPLAAAAAALPALAEGVDEDICPRLLLDQLTCPVVPTEIPRSPPRRCADEYGFVALLRSLALNLAFPKQSWKLLLKIKQMDPDNNPM